MDDLNLFEYYQSFLKYLFSDNELVFTFAVCRRKSVCLSSVCL